MDRREDILNKIWPKMYVVGTGDIKPAVYAAMDEYMKESCLELLEYMAINRVICNGGKFLVRGELLTKEQLFENFL